MPASMGPRYTPSPMTNALVLEFAAIGAHDLPRAQPAPVAPGPVGKAPIGKFPVGKTPVGKYPVAAPAPAPVIRKG